MHFGAWQPIIELREQEFRNDAILEVIVHFFLSFNASIFLRILEYATSSISLMAPSSSTYTRAPHANGAFWALRKRPSPLNQTSWQYLDLPDFPC